MFPDNHSDNSNDDPLSLQPQIAATEYDESEVIVADLVSVRTPPLSMSGFIAWAFVIMLTLTLFGMVANTQLFTAPPIGGDATSADLLQIQIQGKALVGQRRFLEAQGQELPDNVKTVPKALNTGSYEQRLCYAILVSEIEGPTGALEYLETLDDSVIVSEFELTDDQRRIRNTILNLNQQYEDGNFESDTIPAEDRELVESRLDWLGRLAFLPPGTTNKAERRAVDSEATQFALISGFAILAGLIFGLAGAALIVIFLVLLVNGKLMSGFVNRAYDHNIYIETFAVWMGLFFGSSLLMGVVGVEDPQWAMLIQLCVFFGSLIAIGWPVVRGIPFSQVRRDIGWTSEHIAKDAASAFPSYLATLPLLIPGVILASVLVTVISGFYEPHEFARQLTPSHPVQDYIASGGATMILLVFLTACVAAPVVEETFFRGVLYRHLRDCNASWQRWSSVLFAAVVNGLIFASIHPQGIYGIPVLAILAVGFSLAREWRGSLISCVVMHGVHNALITCVTLLIL